ncbi:MAG: Flp family type IVb pilin [Nitrospirales bacterium]|nr:Flp family type IVb pilin [Nitrospirales bacterium]
MPKTNMATIVSNNRGAAMMEYALLVSLVALTILGGFKVLGGGVLMAFSDINRTLNVPTLVDDVKAH